MLCSLHCVHWPCSFSFNDATFIKASFNPSTRFFGVDVITTCTFSADFLYFYHHVLEEMNVTFECLYQKRINMQDA